MSTLAKCRETDPSFRRTVLLRTKLDKYYSDLNADNVNEWVDGHGDLPANLTRFALTLPFWPEGTVQHKSFAELREDTNNEDCSWPSCLACFSCVRGFVALQVS